MNDRIFEAIALADHPADLTNVFFYGKIKTKRGNVKRCMKKTKG
ncbi:MAG: hypothetical protein AB1797_13260 [bacterium]